MATVTPPSKLKNPQEMERIRQRQAALDEAAAKNRKPEPNLAAPLASFEIGRYTQGSFKGLFVVTQKVEEIAYKDKDGAALSKPVKRTVKKTVADGVDMFVAITSLETALRKRVFK